MKIRKIGSLAILVLVNIVILTSFVYALNLSRVKTWSANDVLTAADLNAEFNNILNHTITNSDIGASAAIAGTKLDLSVPGAIGGTTPNAITSTSMTINGNTIIGDAPADTLHVNANTITYEGATADDFEMTLAIPDVGSDTTVTIPNIAGTLASLAGTQTISGTKTFSAQVVSTLATGTSPFSITSTTVNTNLNADLLDGTNTASTVTASSIYISEASTGYLPDATVDSNALKTTTGEVSTTTTSTATLPGGSYGFYPQLKVSGAGTVGVRILGSLNGGVSYSSTTYATIAYLEVVSGGVTLSVQQRYVTSSGLDNWLFLLVDKQNGEIEGAWYAPDHPSYGNGGNPETVPHPFMGNYDPSKHEIILVENEQTESIIRDAKVRGIGVLDIINGENYKADFSQVFPYTPLHSGSFLGEAPVMIETIPDYVVVRKIVWMTDEEKENKQIKIAEKESQRVSKRQIKVDAVKTKLGLTDKEFEDLIDVVKN